MINRKLAGWTIIGAVVAFALAVACSFAHGSTHNRPNSLGVEISTFNPNVYLFGALACDHFEDACTIMKDGKDRLYTNIRFNAYNTPMLNDEAVLFCDNVAGAFANKGGPIVVTYLRQASINYQGVGCHELVSVFEVPAPKEIQ